MIALLARMGSLRFMRWTCFLGLMGKSWRWLPGRTRKKGLAVDGRDGVEGGEGRVVSGQW